MGVNDTSDLLNSKGDDEEDREFWFSGVSGIVVRNDDPEFQCRVQCIIPLIDEKEVYPVWARRMILFAGGPGYGDFHFIAKGAPVALFGRHNDHSNLFYTPVYNETHVVPSDFRNLSTRGQRHDGNYSLIVDGNLYIRAGNIIIESDTSTRNIAPGGHFQMSKPEDEE